MSRPTTDIPNTKEAPTRLNRTLSTPLLVFYGLGVTVGAGIYVLVGETAAQAGGYAPISFLIAACVVAFTAFSYAELSTRIPVSAGEAAYVEAGFRSGWIATVVGLAVAASGMVSAAAVSLGTAAYLSDAIAVPQPILVMVVVAGMGLIALMGITHSVTVAAVITVIEISGLLLVVVWGLLVVDPQGISFVEMLPPLKGSHWHGIGAATLLAFFAFVGFEDMANVAEEVKNPVRTLPRAYAITLVLATALYIATTTAVLIAVPLSHLTASDAPLALIFAAAPVSVQSLFGLIAILATANGVLIQMIMAARVLYGLADRGHLPSGLAHVSKRTQTPAIATGAVIITIAVLASLLPIDALAQHTSQIVLAVFILVNLALILMKQRPAPHKAYFKVPLAIPICGVITSAALFMTALL